MDQRLGFIKPLELSWELFMDNAKDILFSLHTRGFTALPKSKRHGAETLTVCNDFILSHLDSKLFLRRMSGVPSSFGTLLFDQRIS